MDLVVEPAHVSGTGSALRSLAHRVPDLPRTMPGDSGSDAVDESILEFLVSADECLWEAGAAIHDLGGAAVDAAAALVAADRSLR